LLKAVEKNPDGYDIYVKAFEKDIVRALAVPTGTSAPADADYLKDDRSRFWFSLGQNASEDRYYQRAMEFITHKAAEVIDAMKFRLEPHF
jgi:hypothetical protein